MACYLLNISHSTTIDWKNLEEIWSCSMINYYVLGCPTYDHVKEGMLEPRAKKCILLG